MNIIFFFLDDRAAEDDRKYCGKKRKCINQSIHLYIGLKKHGIAWTHQYIAQKKHGIAWVLQYIEPNWLYINPFIEPKKYGIAWSHQCIEPKKHGITVWIQQIMEPNCLYSNAFIHILNQGSVVWFGFIKLQLF